MEKTARNDEPRPIGAALGYDDLVQACRNVGVDLTCGACAAVFYTGYGAGVHTCCRSTSVLQPWLERIPIRMQSTLLLGLRGPDTHACPNVKKIARWLRGLAFKPGNPDNVREFMGEMPDRIVEKGLAAKELEFCSQHYYSHLLHALEVIGYCHPDPVVAGHAYSLFSDMCVLMHLPVESDREFAARLGTRSWPGGGQPDDFAAAVKLLGANGETV